MIPSILEKLSADYSAAEREMVCRAWNEAERLLSGRERGNHHPFIEHPLNVAEIVGEDIGLKADAVTAVLLHEANRFQSDNADGLNESDLMLGWKETYPSDVIEMVKGLNRISFIKLQETNLNEERYRKLIISYSTDPRVVLIKIADRLEVMRNITILPPSKQKGKVMETILLYTPLAHQLGLYQIKSEMEDIFLRQNEPEQYRLITNHLKATEKDREQIAVKFIEPLKEKLDAEGIKYTLKVRTKSAYSIWKKMQKQKVPFERIFDVYAMRFIIDCPAQRSLEHDLCWKVYSLVTEKYTPDTSRLRDWLTRPKSNGYESLHTTVNTGDNSFVEVQIRTTRMDFEAEQGNASHWSYKGVKSEEMLSRWMEKLRGKIASDPDGEFTGITPDILREVYVFTPAGELRQLKQGSTVLDFAFEVHTNVGMHCTGGRINGKFFTIREQLKTGDRVEILTAKNQKPSKDWLKYVATSKARNKIKQYFNKIELEAEEEEKQKAGMISEIPEKEEAVKLAPAPKPQNQQNTDDGYLIISEKSLGKVDFKLARCCNPQYGDDIFGFITVKEGMKIHKMSCPNAARLIENYPYRLQKVRWKKKEK